MKRGPNVTQSGVSATLRLPARIFAAYLYLTLLLAAIGPFEYHVLNPLPVLLYITFVLACFFAGYEISVRRLSPQRQAASGPLIHHSLRFWITAGLILGLGTGVYSVLYEGPQESLNAALANPGHAYQQSILFSAKDTVSRAGQISTLTYGLTIFALAAVFVRRDRFPTWVRWLAVACLMARIAYSLKSGTYKGIGDWMIFGLTLYQLVLYRRRVLTKRNTLYMALAFIIYFGGHIYGQQSRKQAYGLEADYSYLATTTFHSDGIIAKVLGPKAYELICYPVFYVTNGYAGLSASLEQEFVWTYGLGNSIALQTYASQYLAVQDVMPRSYIVRAEKATGWRTLTYWSTIFPWLASDITFPGCGVVFFLLGVLYPRVLCRALYSRCPLSASLLFYLNILLIFVPCNNQLMQTRWQMLGFVGTLLGYWLATGLHRRREAETASRRRAGFARHAGVRLQVA